MFDHVIHKLLFESVILQDHLRVLVIVLKCQAPIHWVHGCAPILWQHAGVGRVHHLVVLRADCDVFGQLQVQIVL